MLSFGESTTDCLSCGKPYPATQLDRQLWCPSCRAIVVRKAALIARITALVVSLVLVFWVFTLVGSAPRFLMIYAVMVIAAYFFVYKLTQRVAFEVIRSRGIELPPEDPDE